MHTARLRVLQGGGTCCDLVPGGGEGGRCSDLVPGQVVDHWCCPPPLPPPPLLSDRMTNTYENAASNELKVVIVILYFLDCIVKI